jgi:hypothetical protein
MIDDGAVQELLELCCLMMREQLGDLVGQGRIFATQVRQAGGPLRIIQVEQLPQQRAEGLPGSTFDTRHRVPPLRGS